MISNSSLTMLVGVGGIESEYSSGSGEAGGVVMVRVSGGVKTARKCSIFRDP